MEVIITLRIKSTNGDVIDRNSLIENQIAAVTSMPNLEVVQVAYSDNVSG